MMIVEIAILVCIGLGLQQGAIPHIIYWPMVVVGLVLMGVGMGWRSEW